jgi:hypothetical protein
LFLALVVIALLVIEPSKLLQDLSVFGLMIKNAHVSRLGRIVLKICERLK